MHLYQRLKDIREDKELSQGEIATVLGISQQHYSMYERGTRELPAHHFIKLAIFYNISADYLLGLAKTPRTLTGEPYQISKKYSINQKGNITNNFN